MIKVDQYYGLMNQKTAAKFIDCSTRTVDRLRKEGYLRPSGRRGLWRYDPQQVLTGFKRMTRDHRRFKV